MGEHETMGRMQHARLLSTNPDKKNCFSCFSFSFSAATSCSWRRLSPAGRSLPASRLLTFRPSPSCPLGQLGASLAPPLPPVMFAAPAPI